MLPIATESGQWRGVVLVVDDGTLSKALQLRRQYVCVGEEQHMLLKNDDAT